MEDLAAAFNDMTARLHEVYRDLDHQVNERSRQLVRSERLASVGFLAAGVAHEINNPLASHRLLLARPWRRGSADYLARNPHETRRHPQVPEDDPAGGVPLQGDHQRLLEFSRVGERRREPTDLAELVQGVLDMVQHLQHAAASRSSSSRTAGWSPGVYGEEIKSVVLNLVVNALDSMDEGGMLTITLNAVGPTAELMFTDTGCGMPPEVLENIFEPFFTRSRTGKGTGLGLSISHRIVSQHGGEIEATSAGPGPGQHVHGAAAAHARTGARTTAQGVLPFGQARKPAGTQTEDGIGHAA